MKYYKAKVKVITQDDKGRQKENTEEYLVHAVSVTDVLKLKFTKSSKTILLSLKLHRF